MQFFPGSMQDYNYVWHGCMEITLEMSCCKYPPATFLESYWKDHLKVTYNYYKIPIIDKMILLIFLYNITIPIISITYNNTYMIINSKNC